MSLNRPSISDILLRCGTDRERFERVAPELAESNRRSLVTFSLLVMVGMAVMLGFSLFDESLVKNRPAYLVAAVICLLLLFVCLGPARTNRTLICVCVYVFTLLLFAFGIMLGTFIEPNEVTVSFVVLLFAVPLLFADRPIRMICAMAAGIAAYFVAARLTQDPVILGYNASNVLPYGIISMALSTYMMHIKVERYLLAQENRILSESDQLTGLWNRRCYEQHLARLRQENNGGYTICNLDVNGLKSVNDNLGHYAGDELIRGAAECVKAVFGPYGRCYRMGGDEFTAILDNPCPAPDELERMLNARTAAWHGTLVSGLAISAGIVPARPGDQADEVIRAADKAMYENKAAYYRRSGIERRVTGDGSHA